MDTVGVVPEWNSGVFYQSRAEYLSVGVPSTGVWLEWNSTGVWLEWDSAGVWLEWRSTRVWLEWSSSRVLPEWSSIETVSVKS